MLKRDLLFWTLFLVGCAAVGNMLLQRDRVRDPKDFRPDRLNTVSTSAATPAVNPVSSDPAITPAPITRSEDPGQVGDIVQKLNAEFNSTWTSLRLPHAPPAAPKTIIRRMSLALTGTVPSLAELRHLDKVPADQQVEWWLSYLLEDARYRDYFSERFARAFVGTDDGQLIVYRRFRFKKWLAQELEKQTPYDQIVRELVADTGFSTAKPAVNFLTSAIVNDEGNRIDTIKLAGRTARAFLGMRIDCLQCHDDKLGNIWLGDPDNPVDGKQSDFHQLVAFYASAQFGLNGVYDTQRDYKFKYLGAKEETLVKPSVPFNSEILATHGSRREQLANWITNPKNRPFARAAVNRIWALLYGKPLMDPIDDIPLTGPFAPGMELLVDDFIANGYNLRRLIRTICLSQPFQVDSRADFDVLPEHERAWVVFPITRLRPEQMASSLIQSSSLATIDSTAHIFSQLDMFGQTNEFVRRFGDIGEDEFKVRAGTIPQRLIMMNGSLVSDRTTENFVRNASTRLAALSTNNQKTIEVAYLAIFTREPSPEEAQYFGEQLAGRTGQERREAIEDLYWTLLNSTEFSWNH